MKKFTIIALLLGSLTMSDSNVQANSLEQLNNVGQLEERKIEILRELNSLKHLASAGNIASNPNLKVNLNDITNSYQKLTQEMKEINDKIKMMEESPPDLDVSLGVKEQQKVENKDEAQLQEKPEVNQAPVAEVADLETPSAQENLEDKSVTEQPEITQDEEVVIQILEKDQKEQIPETQETVEEKGDAKVEQPEPVKEESSADVVEKLQAEQPEEVTQNKEIAENKEEENSDIIVPEQKDELSIKEEPKKVENEQDKQPVVNAPPITAEEPTDFSVTVVLMFVAFTVLFAISKAFENKSPADLGIGGQQTNYGNLFDGSKRAGYSSMSRDGSELKSIDNIYNSWSQDKNIGNRQRSSRLIQIDDESVSI